MICFVLFRFMKTDVIIGFEKTEKCVFSYFFFAFFCIFLFFYFFFFFPFFFRRIVFNNKVQPQQSRERKGGNGTKNLEQSKTNKQKKTKKLKN